MIEPPKHEDADVHALKALAKGVANEAQQRRCLQYFLAASGLRDMPTCPENSLEMAYQNGRRFPGWCVARLIELVGVTTDLTKDNDV